MKQPVVQILEVEQATELGSILQIKIIEKGQFNRNGRSTLAKLSCLISDLSQ